MLNFKKIIEIIIALESIIISSMLPIYIEIPYKNNLFNLNYFPINMQITTILFLTLLFSEQVMLIAFSLYMILGLFIIPVFYDGGSLGYILTPNFGYLLGIYPLIIIINKFNYKIDTKIIKLFKIGFIGLIAMHSVGIIYTLIQLILFNKINLIAYNIGKFSLSKLPFEILMLIPIIFLKKSLQILNNK